ncbi:MAG: DUF4407 domain-containing protein, partial [Hymenobacteraceae bacterium]|nr:DUF4407 domain-containing protein [Hymenobacteraceae bacterium]MDX5396095.1 DUF4407 domain-containing protein [Hymenobacteraceae bacterium]MDX5512160.1 DUF4407 domain-containing protein [Hymenobacteraceae bacterium]
MNRFFWWCAGADDELLRQCPKSEHIKFAGIGATVLFTGVLASFSGGYALYTVFGTAWQAVAFGLLWGAVIFNLDRFIVSTLRKEGRFGKELLQVLPRLVLALLIAVVISKPLELRIFEKEIDSLLQRKQAELALEHKKLVAQQFSETDTIKSEIAGLQAQVAAKEQERNRLYEEMKAEADGTGGTQKIGKGPIYEEKKRQYDKIDEELKQLQVQIQEQIAKREERIGSLTQNQDSVLATAQQRFSNYDGLMARMNALDELPFLPSLFIMLVFIALETAPIFTKL